MKNEGIRREEELVAARPTDRLREGADRLDPMGWARRRLARHGRALPDRHVAKLLALPYLTHATEFDLLSEMPEDWIPRTPEDIGGFVRVARYMSTKPFGGNSPNTDPQALVALLGGYGFLRTSRGRWAEFAARVIEPWPQVHGRIDDSLDMIRAFAQEAVVPTLFRDGLCDDAYELTYQSPAMAVAALVLFEGKGLQAILEESEAWHRVVGGRGGVRLAPGPPWEVPFREVAAPCGTVLRCLSDDAALIEEGYAMAHCVGTYAQSCRSGWSVIVSVRDPEGTRLSTLELRPEGARFVVAQHRAVRNSSPIGTAVAAATWLASALGRSVPVDPAYVKAQAVGERAIHVPRDTLAAATARWAPRLRRPLRDPEALRAAIVAAALRVVRERFPPGEGVTPHGSLSDRWLRRDGPGGNGEGAFDLRVWTRMRLRRRDPDARRAAARIAGTFGPFAVVLFACLVIVMSVMSLDGWGIVPVFLYMLGAFATWALDQWRAFAPLARRRWERRALRVCGECGMAKGGRAADRRPGRGAAATSPLGRT